MPLARTLVLVLGMTSAAIAAQNDRGQAAVPNVAGVYRSIANGTTLPGGLRNSGAPEDLVLLPAAIEQMKAVDLTQDPQKLCQPVGPFRMMAREGLKIELAYARDALVVLFEDISHGNIRTIQLDREHPQNVAATWNGHSVGRWEGDALVIDTVGFNERTWLNSAGAQHTDALHLIEHVKPIQGGKYLEYKVTAEDPQALAKPHSYTRYFEKVPEEIQEDICEQ